MSRSINIGSVVVGTGISGIPFLIFRLAEFYFPFLGHGLSNGAITIGSFFGTMTGAVVALPLYPVATLIEKTMDLYLMTHNQIRKVVAVIYGLTGTEPMNDDPDCCVPGDTMHSISFRREVELASTGAWEQLFFGAPGAGGLHRIVHDRPPAPGFENELPEDPITLDPIGGGENVRVIAVLRDPHGHLFNDYPDRSTGIRGLFAMNRREMRSQTLCPLSREPIREEELVVVPPYGQ